MVLVISNSIVEDDMPDRWLEPENYKIYMRLCFIKSIQSHIPSYCPECGESLTVDEDQIYCPKCGLITQSSTTYSAGLKFRLPHGIKLM